MKVIPILLAMTLSHLATAQASTPNMNSAAGQIFENAIHALSVSPSAQGTKSFALTGSLQAEGTTDSQPVSILSRGRYDFRLELSQPDGSKRVVVKRADGKNGVRDRSGLITRIRRNSRAGTEAPFLPLPQLLSDLVTPDAQIRDIGLDTVNGRQVLRVAISRQFPHAVDPDGVMSARSAIQFSIDAENFLVLQMTHSMSDPTGRWSLTRTVNFADYREVEGIMVPFSIVESLDGQRLCTISISSINFGHKFLDTDFQL